MLRGIGLLAFGMLVQGCATVTSGTTHSMAVLTEPPGAVCQVKRDWQVIGVVNPTPGTISISKSSRDLAIDCSRQGNQPGASVVPAEFQAMTLGNILLGGVIGLAVDAASGALGAYPANVTVVLAPAQFDGLTERDRFYANRADDIRRSFGDRIDTVRRNCTPGAPAVCADSIKLLESQRDDELRQLDSLRLAAPVRGA